MNIALRSSPSLEISDLDDSEGPCRIPLDLSLYEALSGDHLPEVRAVRVADLRELFSPFGAKEFWSSCSLAATDWKSRYLLANSLCRERSTSKAKSTGKFLVLEISSRNSR